MFVICDSVITLLISRHGGRTMLACVISTTKQQVHSVTGREKTALNRPALCVTGHEKTALSRPALCVTGHEKTALGRPALCVTGHEKTALGRPAPGLPTLSKLKFPEL